MNPHFIIASMRREEQLVRTHRCVDFGSGIHLENTDLSRPSTEEYERIDRIERDRFTRRLIEAYMRVSGVSGDYDIGAEEAARAMRIPEEDIPEDMRSPQLELFSYPDQEGGG